MKLFRRQWGGLTIRLKGWVPRFERLHPRHHAPIMIHFGKLILLCVQGMHRICAFG